MLESLLGKALPKSMRSMASIAQFAAPVVVSGITLATCLAYYSKPKP